MIDIPGYEGVYAATKGGDVWAHAREWRTGSGKNLCHSHGGLWLRQRPNTWGYMSVVLNVDGKKKTVTVHRLVAATYLANPLGLPQVNHLDGNKQNNNTSNLEWVTAAQNIRHSYDLGLQPPHTASHIAAARKTIQKINLSRRVLTMQQADEIRRLVASGENRARVADIYGVQRAVVYQIVRGETYVS